MDEITAYKRVCQGKYEVYKDGYFNSDEICYNYNFALGYAVDPEPAQKRNRVYDKYLCSITYKNP